jgi:hypothetical protein
MVEQEIKHNTSGRTDRTSNILLGVQLVNRHFVHKIPSNEKKSRLQIYAMSTKQGK